MTPSTILIKNIKYLGGTPTKEVKDMYEKDCKSLKKDLRRLKISHAHGLAGLV